MHVRRRGLFAAAIRWTGPFRDAPTDDPTTGSEVNGGKPSDKPDTTATDTTDTDGSKATEKAPKIDGDVDKERAERAIAAARAAEEKAKKRAQATEVKLAEAQAASEKAAADMRDKLAVALGLKPDPKADPAEMAKQAAADREAAIKERDDAIAKIAVMQVETAIVRLASKAGADASELLDSSKFRKSINGLEPAAAGFETDLLDAIKSAVKNNPKRYGAAVTAAPANRGADITGTSGGARKRPASLGAAIARKYSG